MPTGVYPRESVESRFRRFARKDANGCWTWLGASNWKGYGKITINGKTVAAHKYSYELHKGPVPAGVQVRHTCDYRGCVNPDHLVLGSNSDNWNDAINRGRRVGLKDEQTLQIFLLRSCGLLYEEIATIAGTNETTARLIEQGKIRPYLKQQYEHALRAWGEA